MDSLSMQDRRRLTRSVGYLAMALIVLVIGLPVWWMFSGSLKTSQEIYTFPPDWIPRNPRWSNFTDAWQSAPFGRFYFNSIVTTVLGSALEITNATLSAYALAYLRFPFKNVIFALLLAAMMIPSQVTVLPNYVFFGATVFDLIGESWVNTYQAIILPGASVAFGTFLMRQSFLGLPREVLDAAKVDGAGHLRTLWDIVLPMARPVLVTFGLISVVAKWNDYLWPLVITQTENMRTLTVGISSFYDLEGNTQWGLVMAATIFVIFPLLVVFVFAQRFIIEGLTAGATKG
ncbi:MAG: ABC transporter, permease protein 2 (cluster 1, maltose/g3p/polyamine/iron) [uncultured Thermomicrobiales bacterium]|uniref:ABC transporter, permease protein 2 (Cluster 1, maltose/g3p/polyamine/iron) n=1 Tax=uncultured Thermomicrobiales bacterium TaxID=1645740 RepID=A0A6J4VRC5_9BACT|nr:MAG: ABC transporter, permease protein 2 (cluster 1, maltose/g3p/polyamine/iron) [uncultured Thermomicrobiales bacterium]